MVYIVLYAKINRCGPLVHLWCMRLEGKHNYFKDLAHRIKCFKNVLKTLAEHYQLTTCYNMSCTDIFENNTDIGPSKCSACITNNNYILMYRSHKNQILIRMAKFINLYIRK